MELVSFPSISISFSPCFFSLSPSKPPYLSPSFSFSTLPSHTFLSIQPQSYCATLTASLNRRSPFAAMAAARQATLSRFLQPARPSTPPSALAIAILSDDDDNTDDHVAAQVVRKPLPPLPQQPRRKKKKFVDASDDEENDNVGLAGEHSAQRQQQPQQAHHLHVVDDDSRYDAAVVG